MLVQLVMKPFLSAATIMSNKVGSKDFK